MSRIQAKIYAQAILNLALEKGGLAEASDISHSYDSLLETYNDIEHAEVVTALPLNKKDEQKLSLQLRKMRGCQVIIDAHTDPTIIGGIKIKIGNMLIDGSIRHKLESLRRSLLENLQ
jgi:F-type H+-transporting ATPase subunit delta